jgi:hypothetical protein
MKIHEQEPVGTAAVLHLIAQQSSARAVHCHADHLLLNTCTPSTLFARVLYVQQASGQGLYSSSLLKTVSSPINPTGKFFNYTFTAKNLALPGPTNDFVTLYDVVVTDNFPVGVAPTQKHWFKVDRNSSSCTFSGADSRIMRCSLGRMVAEEEVEFTVEVKADGKNFVGEPALTLTDTLNNTAIMTCTNNKTATTPDTSCTRQSTVSTKVGAVLSKSKLTIAAHLQDYEHLCVISAAAAVWSLGGNDVLPSFMNACTLSSLRQSMLQQLRNTDQAVLWSQVAVYFLSSSHGHCVDTVIMNI